MGFIKCFDVVEMVTDEATKQFGRLFTESNEGKQWLKEYCKKVDTIAEQFNGVSYEVDVDDETMDITISLVCGEFETDKTSTAFHEVMQGAKKVAFKSGDSGEIQIDFILSGIWNKAF